MAQESFMEVIKSELSFRDWGRLWISKRSRETCGEGVWEQR